MPEMKSFNASKLAYYVLKKMPVKDPQWLPRSAGSILVLFPSQLHIVRQFSGAMDRRAGQTSWKLINPTLKEFQLQALSMMHQLLNHIPDEGRNRPILEENIKFIISLMLQILKHDSLTRKVSKFAHYCWKLGDRFNVCFFTLIDFFHLRGIRMCLKENASCCRSLDIF